MNVNSMPSSTSKMVKRAKWYVRRIVIKPFATLTFSPQSCQDPTSMGMDFMYKAPAGFSQLAADKPSSSEEKAPTVTSTAVVPGEFAGPDNRSGPAPGPSAEEKFPMLKNAPTEGQYALGAESKLAASHKPFGVQLRNVRCSKCNQWGHQARDRECPKFNEAGQGDDWSKHTADPMAQGEKPELKGKVRRDEEPVPAAAPRRHAGLADTCVGGGEGTDRPQILLKRSACSPVRGSLQADDPLHQLLESDPEDEESDDSDIEAKFLAGLTTDQKRELLKRYQGSSKKKKDKKKDKKSKKDKKKDKKSKSEKKRKKHDSDSSEDDEMRKSKKHRD